MNYKGLTQKFMIVYSEDEYLQIAGIQHYTFCKRQWALIHIEQQWGENVLTVEGNLVHEKAHNDSLREKRGNTIITRGLEVRSSTLGIYGICDVVEFKQDNDGIVLKDYQGTWLPCPVEYKRGKPKTNDADRLQLCAQVVCLEELFDCKITNACLFYDEIKHRETIEINEELRNQLSRIVAQMHDLYDKRHTPKVKQEKFCFSCSLKDICIPSLYEIASAKDYIRKHMEESI